MRAHRSTGDATKEEKPRLKKLLLCVSPSGNQVDGLPLGPRVEFFARSFEASLVDAPPSSAGSIRSRMRTASIRSENLY
jgi:hypothetical protein